MSIIVNGVNSGVGLDVDSNNNGYIRGNAQQTFGAAGGGFCVTGQTSAVVAAALAANTHLVSLRFNTGSTRNAYLTRLRLVVSPATLGAAGGVAGTLGWQRFTAQTPTGGTARTPARKDLSTGSGSDMFDVRDSNAALTGTAPTWGDVVACSLVPLFVSSAGGFEWIVDMDDMHDVPVRLTAGDGIGLRTQVAMAATQTWVFAYTVHWFEE